MLVYVVFEVVSKGLLFLSPARTQQVQVRKSCRIGDGPVRHIGYLSKRLGINSDPTNPGEEDSTSGNEDENLHIAQAKGRD